MELIMKKNKSITQFLILASLLMLLLSSCDYSKIKFGDVRMMFGSNEDGHISYTFSTFTGFERGSAQAESGQIINFDYQVNVDQGTLNIEWQDPAGVVIWQKTLLGSDQGHDDIVIKSPGEYTIIIQGRDSAGNFDVSWKIE